MSQEQLAAVDTFLDALQAAAPPEKHELALVRFARRAEITQRPLERFQNPDDSAHTNLAAGISLAVSMARASGLPESRVIVLSDGRETLGDLPGLGRLVSDPDMGIPIFAVALPRPTPRDVAISRLSGPRQCKTGEPFDIKLEAEATVSPAAARVVLMRDGHPVDASAERVLEFDPHGKAHTTWTVAIDARSATVFEARLVDAAPDEVSTNNVEHLVMNPEQPPTVLVVSDDATETAALRQALRAQNIQSVAITARAFAQEQDLQLQDDRFEDHDLILLANVPRTSVPDALVARMASYVENGGGLLVTGGPGSFGSGGFHGTPMEQLLPVSLEIPGPREQATLALAVVIDRSGSMSGAKIELTKEAARQTALGLPADDMLAVIAFDSRAESIVRLQKAGNRQRILSQIEKIHAGGGTNILPALSEAYQQLLAVDAKKKHIILLSDGQSHAGEIRALVADAAAAHITVSTVGVGSGADQTILKQIAERGGGRFHHTEDPASIPRIFSRETTEVRPQPMREQPTRLRALRPSSLLNGVAIDSAPALLGYNLTRAKPDAEVILAGADNRPLLARWQVGLGQVGVWTSDLGSRWAAALMKWKNAGLLWAQVARALMRTDRRLHFPIDVSITGTHVKALVEAADAPGSPLMGLRGALRMVPAQPSIGADEAESFDLRETAPGRYEARFSRPGPGAYMLSARMSPPAPSGDSALATGGFAVVRPAELERGGPGDDALADLVASSGGRWLTPADPEPRPGTSANQARPPARQPLSAHLVALSLVLFVAAVGLRRATFRTPQRH